MPRIPDQLQHSIVFLFPNADAARNGTGAGGTGFVVELPSKTGENPNTYLITNVHVALGGNRTLRINQNNGEDSVTFETEASGWVSHSNGDDIAVYRIEIMPTWKLSAISWADLAVTPDRLNELNMGVGDEVVMIGRFISHDGIQINQPLARFGNIAMMPDHSVKDGRGIKVEAYLVEMRSLSGFSGSPVFVYMGPGTYRGNGMMMPFYKEVIGLMGIDTGHKVISEKVINNQSGNCKNAEVRLNTGISIVSPSWKIKEVLDKAEDISSQ
jgi:hypothetical protein